MTSPAVLTGPAEPPQEKKEETISDADSGFGIIRLDSNNTTEIYSYVYENGRRYHSYREGSYFLPNDKREMERLDLYHHIFKAILGGELHLAPLGKEVKHILDIGTGTGSWALDMAEEFPDTEVIGNDLSKIQPPWVPPNCKFEIDDAESDWTHPKNHFDLIHARTLSGCFQDWDLFLTRCYDHTAPGGYFEFHDYDGLLSSSTGDLPDADNSPFVKWWSLVIDCAAKTGHPFQVASSMKEWIEKAGFVDVTERVELWPLGDWPEDRKQKEVGRWARDGMCESLYSFGTALLARVLGWNEESIKDLCMRAAVELENDQTVKYYVKAYYIYGRKPATDEK